ncbi:hypothetical protein [Bacillus sp. I-2]|uniref:hypothetical protein n=1 Tax=Bacillus sp. I-2 TaxID=1857572 RepID=UPI000977D1CB|nr:hypothetical protein [Bacillus sp. I-2]OMP27748.1 hypothetical protein BAE31_06195 [Bacillus sp. I-2]
MTKKKGIFEVEVDINLFKQSKETEAHDKLLISTELGTVSSRKKNGRDLYSAMEIIIQKMRVSGYRDRTITDYIRYIARFRKVANVKCLDSMQVSN